MTLMETLRQLFGSKLDEEIETGLDEKDKEKENEQDKKEQSTEDKKSSQEKMNDNKESDKKEPVDKEDESEDIVEETIKEEVKDVAIFGDGWYDATTGKVDVSKISNEEAVKAIQTLQNAYEAEKSARMINDSINGELDNYSLAVSKDTLLKVLDTSGVKIDKEGKVNGVKEAIESLKTSEPGFFKDKDKESNPLNEGFNPVEKRNTGNVNSFSEAFRLMEEIS